MICKKKQQKNKEQVSSYKCLCVFNGFINFLSFIHKNDYLADFGEKNTPVYFSFAHLEFCLKDAFFLSDWQWTFIKTRENLSEFIRMIHLCENLLTRIHCVMGVRLKQKDTGSKCIEKLLNSYKNIMFYGVLQCNSVLKPLN